MTSSSGKKKGSPRSTPADAEEANIDPRLLAQFDEPLPGNEGEDLDPKLLAQFIDDLDVAESNADESRGLAKTTVKPAYEVGYGRPPLHSRIKPGEVRNPKGQ